MQVVAHVVGHQGVEEEHRLGADVVAVEVDLLGAEEGEGGVCDPLPLPTFKPSHLQGCTLFRTQYYRWVFVLTP